MYFAIELLHQSGCKCEEPAPERDHLLGCRCRMCGASYRSNAMDEWTAEWSVYIPGHRDSGGYRDGKMSNTYPNLYVAANQVRQAIKRTRTIANIGGEIVTLRRLFNARDKFEFPTEKLNDFGRGLATYVRIKTREGADFEGIPRWQEGYKFTGGIVEPHTALVVENPDALTGRNDGDVAVHELDSVQLL